MTDFLITEVIQNIRKGVNEGKTKLQISKELGINYGIVRKYAKDTKRRRVYTAQDIQRMRELVKETNNKAEVARQMNIPYDTVLKYTLDIKVKNKTFGEKTWNLLREIMEKGYVHLNNGKTTKIYMLRKHFPSIQMARVKGKSIAFLPDRKEEAMRAMLQKFDKKVWSYYEVKQVTKLFDADLKREEKQKLVEKDSGLKGKCKSYRQCWDKGQDKQQYS